MRPVGFEHCRQTGYNGMGIFELFEIDDECVTGYTRTSTMVLAACAPAWQRTLRRTACAGVAE